MYFIDEVKIHVKAGDGGNGCASFHRAKYVEFGGPDGGDGGYGGSVILTSDSHINTLAHFRHKRDFSSTSGENGKGQNRSGKSGNHLILKVPVGTQVFSEDGNFLLHDFTESNQQFEVAKGGKGGLGNSHFKSSINQAPRRKTDGEEGQELEIWLKLKLLSDVGIIGLPNAGKSTFLASTTSATPKIADYPFTTLSPSLGVVYINDEEFVLADIPGLIEGAHLGHGLGDKFLKHIERCTVLLHLIDGSSNDVIKDYNIIRQELISYAPNINNKVEIICLNKCDILTQNEIDKNIALLKECTNKDVFPISAHTKSGITGLLKTLLYTISQTLTKYQ